MIEPKKYCPFCHIYVTVNDAKIIDGQRWHKHHVPKAPPVIRYTAEGAMKVN